MKEVDEEAKKMRVMLAASVEYWRKRYNMSKRGLVKASGVPERTLYHIINSETPATVDDIGRLARGLKVKPATLLKPVKDSGDE